jgi:hypothetical protein
MLSTSPVAETMAPTMSSLIRIVVDTRNPQRVGRAGVGERGGREKTDQQRDYEKVDGTNRSTIPTATRPSVDETAAGRRQFPRERRTLWHRILPAHGQRSGQFTTD